MLNTTERRLKSLEMEGKGFTRPEIVKHLAKEYQLTKRAIQYDFSRRARWQPQLQQFDPEKTLLKIANRFEQIYRLASFNYLQNNNENARIAALKLMLDATSRLCDVLVLPEIHKKLDLLTEEAKAKQAITRSML